MYDPFTRIKPSFRVRMLEVIPPGNGDLSQIYQRIAGITAADIIIGAPENGDILIIESTGKIHIATNIHPSPVIDP